MTQDRDRPRTTDELAGSLRRLVVDTIEELVRAHAPGWRLPATFGGHRVDPDVDADLVHTLGHLHEGGIATVSDTPVDQAISRVLARIDGASTHTFFSYRVAETLLQWGPFEGNPLLAGLSGPQRDQVALACDSSEWLELLDQSILPRNYAGVLARCEVARRQLGLIDDDVVVERLVERVRDVLSVNPWHHLDDSNHRVGRYDIYTADVWLFALPLADRLGPLWRDGMTTALGLVERVMSSDGSAVPWGRSTGPLAGALTVEMSAVAVSEQLGDDPALWTARGALAASGMPGWFDGGVVNAHQHRDADRYRGPFRRLQLTLDLLGKLAWAANRFDHVRPPVDAATTATAHADVDELVRFDPETPAAVWTHRSRGHALVIPFVGATRSDYLAAPRAPGRYEVPVDAALACWVPTVFDRGRRATTSGVPVVVTHTPGCVTATWDRYTVGADLEPDPDDPTVGGAATVTYRVAGRTVRAQWDLAFDDAPEALVFLVPERADQPLRVTVQPDVGTVVHVDRVDVDGIAEWRSHWSALHAVHQVEVEPATTAALTLAVTPALRVASTAFGHHYDRSLYGPLTGLVWERPSPWGPLGDAGVDPATVDLLHLHWPEWVAFDDPDTHRGIVDDLDRRNVPVVWTAHNLTPHEKRPEAYDPIYQLWAGRADAVIHHSHNGMQRFLDRYGSPPSTRHVVIPHGHFGDLWADHAPDRTSAETALGLTSGPLRIGIVGAPRREKLVAEFLRGVAASHRADIQVVCWSLGPGDEVPDDPRIVVAEAYDMVGADTYATRLAACDVLALPFDPDGEMLATGTVFDALGLGMPVLRSDWSFLVESLGDAGIDVGHSATSVAEAIDGLDGATLDRARVASVLRRDELAWDMIAARTLALFEDVING